MKIRFQADADLRVPIIKGLRRREPAIEFRTANESGLTGIDDWAVLVLAASNGRLLVTHDVSTMPETFSRFIQDQISPGVIPHLSGPLISASNRRITASLVKY